MSAKSPSRRVPPKPPANTSSSSPGLQSQKQDSKSYDRLKLKYLTVDRNYENLKQLARKGEQLVRTSYGTNYL